MAAHQKWLLKKYKAPDSTVGAYTRIGAMLKKIDKAKRRNEAVKAFDQAIAV